MDIACYSAFELSFKIDIGNPWFKYFKVSLHAISLEFQSYEKIPTGIKRNMTVNTKHDSKYETWQ